MFTVQKLLVQKDSPYKVPVKVEVIGVGPTKEYIKNGVTKTSTEIALADQTAAIKAICYDSSKVTSFRTGSQVMIRNYIARDKMIVITSVSKISATQGVNSIPEAIRENGKRLLDPPKAPEVVLIATAKTFTTDTPVSISGKVIRVNDVQMRNISHEPEPVPVRAIVVKDASGEATVSLWRELAKKDVVTGTHLLITNIRTNYFKGIQFNTNYKSTVTEVESPCEEVEVHVDGFYEEDGKVILVCNLINTEEFVDYICTQDVLQSIIMEEEDRDTALSGMLPFNAKMKVKSLETGAKYSQIEEINIIN